MELIEKTIGNEQWSTKNKGADKNRWMGGAEENRRNDLGEFEVKRSTLMM
jgi:hypothetical protein